MAYGSVRREQDDDLQRRTRAPQTSGAIHEITGTDMRRLLAGDREPEPHLMRPEVIASLAGLRLVAQEDEL